MRPSWLSNAAENSSNSPTGNRTKLPARTSTTWVHTELPCPKTSDRRKELKGPRVSSNSSCHSGNASARSKRTGAAAIRLSAAAAAAFLSTAAHDKGKGMESPERINATCSIGAPGTSLTVVSMCVDAAAEISPDDATPPKWAVAALRILATSAPPVRNAAQKCAMRWPNCIVPPSDPAASMRAAACLPTKAPKLIPNPKS
mmetsp:Transcript_105930/g.338285  ORF Transcript_105930/g.338285 Transcript_105930/m.338285 type:complete len:201 (+) Transcript_105930:3367-3969(+)